MAKKARKSKAAKREGGAWAGRTTSTTRIREPNGCITLSTAPPSPFVAISHVGVVAPQGSTMSDIRFHNLSDEELADIWYALSGAEIRHPDCFRQLVADTIRELELRRGHSVKGFLDQRFARLRSVDAVEDVVANKSATTGCESAERTQPDERLDPD
jgi:hypothetical protein